jgi:hypothetical protein
MMSSYKSVTDNGFEHVETYCPRCEDELKVPGMLPALCLVCETYVCVDCEGNLYADFPEGFVEDNGVIFCHDCYDEHRCESCEHIIGYGAVSKIIHCTTDKHGEILQVCHTCLKDKEDCDGECAAFGGHCMNICEQCFTEIEQREEPTTRVNGKG